MQRCWKGRCQGVEPYVHLRVCGPKRPENSTDMRGKGHRFISSKFPVARGELLRKSEKTQSVHDTNMSLERCD